MSGTDAERKIIRLGNQLFEYFHFVGLFVIGASVVWASWVEVLAIIEHGGPSIKDVLLLFIYLELGAMVGIYFQTKRLPTRYLIYIAITALTRVLAVDAKTMEDQHLIAVTSAILIRCAPRRAKRRRVVPGRDEGALFSRSGEAG